jgi:hypothetical protein
VNGTLSWQEQRNFTNLGLDALGNHTLVKDIVYQLNQIPAKKPDMSGEIKTKKPDMSGEIKTKKPNMSGEI